MYFLAFLIILGLVLAPTLLEYISDKINDSYKDHRQHKLADEKNEKYEQEGGTKLSDRYNKR